MGYKVNFTDNQSVTGSDINDISLSMEEAATDFEDGVLYGVDALNGISATLITSGVSTGCDAVINDGIVTISAGVAYFADGKKIVIDSDGITLSAPEGKSYVWLLNDGISGVVSAKCTNEEPSGDCVRLAEISGGRLKKMKDLARMKNGSLLPNCYKEFELDVHGYDTLTEQTLDIGENYRKMVLICSDTYSPNSKYGLCFFDWDEGKAYCHDGIPYEPSEMKIQLKCAELVVKSFENNVLTFTSVKHYLQDGNNTSVCRLICM